MVVPSSVKLMRVTRQRFYRKTHEGHKEIINIDKEKENET